MDLRDEVDDPQWVETLKDDYRAAQLDQADLALLDACVKLTLQPTAFGAGDIATLREHGFDDVAIHDAVQVCGYFNYINRVVDGLGIDLESFMPAEPRGWRRTE